MRDDWRGALAAASPVRLETGALLPVRPDRLPARTERSGSAPLAHLDVAA
jgi:hypothetical protein